ncbi:MAG: AraC family transcriptional regulator [Suipraeoptans sp.]
MQYVNYREKRIRGTEDFPLEYHHVSPSHPQYVMSLHWHVEYEIIRIIKGSFTVTIDEHTFLATENTCIFIPGGAVHSGIPHDCIYECIVFDTNMLMNKNELCKRIIRNINNHEIILRDFYDHNYNDIITISNFLFDTVASKKNGYQMVSFGALYQLFGIIFSNEYYETVPTISSSKHHKRLMNLKTSLEFIESSFQDSITLDEIAESVNMSSKYFCRFFHDMTNKTPIEYLNYYRIDRACYQLLSTNQSITETAYNCGFNDLSYFIKTFKKYKGVTPKNYLKS